MLLSDVWLSRYSLMPACQAVESVAFFLCKPVHSLQGDREGRGTRDAAVQAGGRGDAERTLGQDPGGLAQECARRLRGTAPIHHLRWRLSAGHAAAVPGWCFFLYLGFTLGF